MRAHGHASVWRTHIGVGLARDAKGWYQQLGDWWTAHKAARRDAKLASLRARWDSSREVVRPLRAEAAPEMITTPRARSVAAMLYALSE